MAQSHLIVESHIVVSSSLSSSFVIGVSVSIQSTGKCKRSDFAPASAFQRSLLFKETTVIATVIRVCSDEFAGTKAAVATIPFLCSPLAIATAAVFGSGWFSDSEVRLSDAITATVTLERSDWRHQTERLPGSPAIAPTDGSAASAVLMRTGLSGATVLFLSSEPLTASAFSPASQMAVSAPTAQSAVWSATRVFSSTAAILAFASFPDSATFPMRSQIRIASSEKAFVLPSASNSDSGSADPQVFGGLEDLGPALIIGVGGVVVLALLTACLVRRLRREPSVSAVSAEEMRTDAQPSIESFSDVISTSLATQMNAIVSTQWDDCLFTAYAAQPALE
jgi:hypothetical protein